MNKIKKKFGLNSTTKPISEGRGSIHHIHVRFNGFFFSSFIVKIVNVKYVIGYLCHSQYKMPVCFSSFVLYVN